MPDATETPDRTTRWQIVASALVIVFATLAAYLPSQQISIVIDNTHGPNAKEGISIATEIFMAVAKYLVPNSPT